MRARREGGTEGEREVRGVKPGVTAGSRWTVQRSGGGGDAKKTRRRRRRGDGGEINTVIITTILKNKKKNRLKGRGIKGKR